MIWCELKIKAQVQVQAWTLIWTFFKAHAKTWSYLRTQDQVWPATQLCFVYKYGIWQDNWETKSITSSRTPLISWVVLERIKYKKYGRLLWSYLLMLRLWLSSPVYFVLYFIAQLMRRGCSLLKPFLANNSERKLNSEVHCHHQHIKKKHWGWWKATIGERGPSNEFYVHEKSFMCIVVSYTIPKRHIKRMIFQHCCG